MQASWRWTIGLVAGAVPALAVAAVFDSPVSVAVLVGCDSAPSRAVFVYEE